MVNPSILLGLAPLAGHVSALYIPHDDNSAFVNDHANSPSNELSEDPNASTFPYFENDENRESREDGKVHKDLKSKKEKKKHGKKSMKKQHHGAKHEGCGKSVNAAKKGSDDVSESRFGIKPVKPDHVIEVNGVISHAQAENVIPDSYIVILKNGAKVEESLANLAMLSQTAMQNLMQSGQSHHLAEGEDATGFDITHVYNKSSFMGYAGKLLPEAVELLAKQPEVAFIETDSKVHTLNPKEEDQAPWGLARVSHRDPLGLATYNKYLYDGGAGEGVTSYIVDTGVYIDHEDFEGRAIWGKTMPAGDSDTDAHGHGSHCAGTIGGKKYGVAKKAKLVAVKVLGSDGSGSMSDVIGGVEYVVEAHRAEQKKKGSKSKGSTANMSLGGGKSPALDLAVNAATEAGVHFAVAAGNENQDACNTSPAGAEGAVTVGATDVRDNRAYFSNYGKCVDIFAPGVNVLSVGTYSPSSTAVMSGTSMASPHIAGLLTYFVSLQPSSDSQFSTRGSISTKELKKYLIEFGTTDAISDLDSDSPNVLAYNGGGEDISSFWSGKSIENDEEESDDEDEDDDGKKGSFFDRVGDVLEDFLDEVEESVHDLF